jgi:hypothetical protein
MEMSSSESEQMPEGLALARALRIRDYIEQLVAAVGEHSECELKKSWLRNTPFLRAEMIKDFQSTANSAIDPDKEKFIAIGIDEQTRTITGCNPADYDEAGIRQLLEQYLDPLPEYEVLSLKSHAGVDFVVVRFPFQQNRPIVAKAQIRDDRNRILLDAGQIWLKPGRSGTGGTGKRLVNSRQELIELINIEQRVEREVEARLEQLLPEIRLEERTRLQATDATIVPVLTATDEEFESYIEQLLAGERINHLRVVLEKLRDHVVLCWQSGFDEHGHITAQRIKDIKEQDFLPAVRRLSLLGMLLIKFAAPLNWFESVVDLFVQIFESSHTLRGAQSPRPPDDEIRTLSEHDSYTVPALEALLGTYLLSSYALVIRERTEYLRSLFPCIVKAVEGPNEPESQSFMLFWPLTYRWRTPNVRRDMLVVERYARGDRIEALMGNADRLKQAVLQVDCLVDWHAVLAQPPPQGEAETHGFFTSKYAGIGTWYTQNFTKQNLEYVAPLVSRLWNQLVARSDNLFLDEELAEIVNGYDIERRKQILAKFLAYAERQLAAVEWANQRFPFPVYWQPPELNNLVKAVPVTPQ